MNKLRNGIKFAVIVNFSLLFVQPTHATNEENIDSICLKNDLSTYEKSKCFSNQENTLSNQLNELYKKLIDEKKITIIENDISLSEADFQKYLESECKLEADAVVGSAGAFIYPRCKFKLLNQRLSFFNNLKKSADDGLYVLSNDSQGK